MATVYLAEDLKHQRKVAPKSLLGSGLTLDHIRRYSLGGLACLGAALGAILLAPRPCAACPVRLEKSFPIGASEGGAGRSEYVGGRLGLLSRASLYIRSAEISPA